MAEGADYTEFVGALLGEGYIGWLCFGRIRPGQTAQTPDFKVDVQDWFQWPYEEPAINEFIQAHLADDLYMSPMLFDTKRRVKDNVSYTPVLWVDVDTADPELFALEPTILVETSPGRYQAYWLLSDTVQPMWAESMSRRITYTQRAKGSDTGWSLGKFLRVPGTTNNKYKEPFTVQMLVKGEVYSADDIIHAFGAVDVSALAGMNREMPKVMPDRTLVLAKVPLEYQIQNAMTVSPDDNADWSKKLFWLECELFRYKLTAPEVFVAVRGCACDKYERDRRPEIDLWVDVLRAEASVAQQMLTGIEPALENEIFEFEAPRFVTVAERDSVDTTFIDRYVEWAAGKTRADKGYHEFSAMAILSTVLGDFGYAIPKFGRLQLNMWFMIMGVTTRTYKTTAKRLMLDVLRLIRTDNYDYDLGSDATAEGLISEMADRPDRSVLFHRDEVDALFDASKGGKGYMGGFLEFLTEAFDGYMRGKIRSTGSQKRTEEVAVAFNAYFAGVPDKIGMVLTPEDFASGFMVRFLFCIGKPEPASDTMNHHEQQVVDAQSRPNDTAYLALCQSLLDARNYWAQRASPDNKTPIILDQPALDRMNQFITEMDKIIAKSKYPEVVEAGAKRMTIAVWKLSCLVAMMSRRSVVSLTDMLTAIIYAERWYLGLNQVIAIVGRNAFAAQVMEICTWVSDNGPVSYAQLVRRFSNYTPRQWDDVYRSAIDQQRIKEDRVGNARMVTAL